MCYTIDHLLDARRAQLLTHWHTFSKNLNVTHALDVELTLLQIENKWTNIGDYMFFKQISQKLQCLCYHIKDINFLVIGKMK